ncbi:MAG: DUF4401 domain-containing protein [Deltaproteobacteria bacterium]|nr:MAG: DUF4401 domain-containing protein [Deltaproteobacteria bacterium]
MTSFSLSRLVNQLSQENLLTEQETEALRARGLELAPEEQQALADQPAPKTSVQDTSPWYINVLIGFSAWLSSVFMIAFLLAVRLLSFREKFTFFVAGIAFLGIGVAIYQVQRGRPSVFLNQMALALTMTGRILSVIGAALVAKDPTQTALYVVVMEVILIVLYAEKLQRFLSTFLIHGAILFILSHNNLVPLVYSYIALLSLLLYGLWVYEFRLPTSQLQELLGPIGYGTAVALLTVMAFSTTPATRAFLRVELWWPITAVMAVAWLLSCLSIAHQYRVGLTSPLGLFTMLTLAVFCASAYQAPGITAACFVLTLAYHRDERLMAGIAILGMVGFVVIYYYGLRITLLQKSMAMLIPGLVLLLARGALLGLSRSHATSTASAAHAS